jgi:hypothetical protein
MFRELAREGGRLSASEHEITYEGALRRFLRKFHGILGCALLLHPVSAGKAYSSESVFSLLGETHAIYAKSLLRSKMLHSRAR